MSELYKDKSVDAGGGEESFFFPYRPVSRSRRTWAVCLSPYLGVLFSLGVPLAVLDSKTDSFGGLILAVLGFPLFGAIIAYPISFLFGLPFVYYSEKFNRRSFWHYLLGGVCSGLLLNAYILFTSVEKDQSYLLIGFLFFVPAVSVALTAWFIMYAKWPFKKEAVL
jgi:hypothetical protein